MQYPIYMAVRGKTYRIFGQLRYSTDWEKRERIEQKHEDLKKAVQAKYLALPFWKRWFTKRPEEPSLPHSHKDWFREIGTTFEIQVFVNGYWRDFLKLRKDKVIEIDTDDQMDDLGDVQEMIRNVTAPDSPGNSEPHSAKLPDAWEEEDNGED